MTGLRFGGVIAALGAALICVPGALSAPPSNDDLTNAAAISGGSGTVTASIVDATHEADEPLHAGQPGTGSIWFSWTAPGDLRATFDTCGSAGGTFLAVYTGSTMASLVLVSGNHDACNYRGRVEFDAAAGATYLIAVDSDGWWPDATLRWETTPLIPRNIAPPTISGEPLTNRILVATSGTWAHATAFSYVWLSCPPENTKPTAACRPIDRGTDPNDNRLRVPTNELGRRIAVDVYARGPHGNGSASSALTAPVTVGPPRNISEPNVDGYTIVGETLEADEGSWDLGGGARVSVTYLWQRCTAEVQDCHDVKGPSGNNKYLVSAADRGAMIQVVVTMTTTAGSASAAGVAPGMVTLPERSVTQRRCVVPRLVGKSLKAARKSLSKAKCRLGAVRRTTSRRRAGTIVAQQPKPGTRLRPGGKVSVRVSLGRRR
jgi:hypothetical protein